MKENMSSPASERAILAGLFSHGIDAHIDVDDLISAETFTSERNQIIYSCLQKVFETSQTVDIPSIISVADSLGYSSYLGEEFSKDSLRDFFDVDTELVNIRNHAKKIKKYEIGRDIRNKAQAVQNEISEMKGEETVDQLISIAESPFHELSVALSSSVEDKPVTMGSGATEYVEHLEENPCDNVGISSGFYRFDTAIGGGFRRKGVDLIGARAKTGKSMFADNVAMHVSSNLDIPVLILDTEMSIEDHWNRILANLSGVDINKISSGKFAQEPAGKEKVYQATEKLNDLPFYHINIAGRQFKETLSIIRRWIKKEVGYDENGRTNDCLVIYDYLKLMDASDINSNMAEYQVLGFQITELVNFTIKHDIACLAFVQLNRDGITKESTDAISGSDRLVWLCSSFTIFKNKSDEEIAEDQGQTGNKKLVCVEQRHGAGLADYDYINLTMTGNLGRIEENSTKLEAQKENKINTDGFDNEIQDDEKPF